MTDSTGRDARKNRVLTALILSVFISASGLAATYSPAMAVGSCNGPGWLCFYDYGTSTYGNVSGNNNNWGNFGWNDRADWFYNWGNYYNVCIYQHSNRGGAAVYLPIGYQVTWYNIVSSNAWVTSGGAMCPQP
jgi:hypothetical protein